MIPLHLHIHDGVPQSILSQTLPWTRTRKQLGSNAAKAISSDYALAASLEHAGKVTLYRQQEKSTSTALIPYRPAPSVLRDHRVTQESEASPPGVMKADKGSSSGFDVGMKIQDIPAVDQPVETHEGAFQPAIRSGFLGKLLADYTLPLTKIACSHTHSQSTASLTWADDAFFAGETSATPKLVNGTSPSPADAYDCLEEDEFAGDRSNRDSNHSRSSTLVEEYEAGIKELEEDYVAAQKVAEDRHQLEIDLIIDDQEVMEVDLRSTINELRTNGAQFRNRTSMRMKESSSELDGARRTIARLERDLRANIQAANQAREQRDVAQEALVAANKSSKINTASFAQELATTTAHLQRVKSACQDLNNHYEIVVEEKLELEPHIEATVQDNTINYIEEPWEDDHQIRPNQIRDLQKALMVSQNMHEKECKLSATLASDLQERNLLLKNADLSNFFLQELVEAPGMSDSEDPGYGMMHLRHKLERALVDHEEEEERFRQQITRLGAEKAELESSSTVLEFGAIGLQAEVEELKENLKVAKQAAMSWHEQAGVLAFGSATNLKEDLFYAQKDAHIQLLNDEVQFLRRVTPNQERQTRSIESDFSAFYWKVESDMAVAEGWRDQRDLLSAKVSAYEKRFAPILITDPLLVDVAGPEVSRTELEQLQSIRDCRVYTFHVDPSKREGDLPNESEYEKLRQAVKAEEDKRLAEEVAQNRCRNEAADDSWIYALPDPTEPTSTSEYQDERKGMKTPTIDKADLRAKHQIQAQSRLTIAGPPSAVQKMTGRAGRQTRAPSWRLP